MASEAKIIINGQTLTDQESMTVRLAMDALANILGEELRLKKAGLPLGDAYLAAISHVRNLIGSSAAATTTVN